LRISDCGVIERNYGMNSNEFKERIRAFALRIIHLVESLPRKRIADVVGGQLLRSGTSVVSNYRAACRAKSTADFISKMGTVEEEADETLYWMELLLEDGIVEVSLLEPLMKEADEIVAITVSSIKTARKNNRIRTGKVRD